MSVSIAQKYMLPTTASVTTSAAATTAITTTTSPDIIVTPRRVAGNSPRGGNRLLNELIRVTVAPAHREYGISLVKMLDGKPHVA